MNDKKIKRVTKFCLSGGVGVSAYYVTLYSLTEFAHVWYIVSAIVAYIINQVANFVLQKLWTFENKDTTKVHIQAVKYVAMGLSFLLLNTGALYVLVEWMNIQLYAAQVLLTILLSILSYFISSKIFSNNIST